MRFSAFSRPSENRRDAANKVFLKFSQAILASPPSTREVLAGVFGVLTLREMFAADVDALFFSWAFENFEIKSFQFLNKTFAVCENSTQLSN